MTGQELKLMYMSLGWSGRQAAEALGVTPNNLYKLTKRQEVDKRTELAILYLKQKETQSNEDGN